MLIAPLDESCPGRGGVAAGKALTGDSGSVDAAQGSHLVLHGPLSAPQPCRQAPPQAGMTNSINSSAAAGPSWAAEPLPWRIQTRNAERRCQADDKSFHGRWVICPSGRCGFRPRTSGCRPCALRRQRRWCQRAFVAGDQDARVVGLGLVVGNAEGLAPCRGSRFRRSAPLADTWMVTVSVGSSSRWDWRAGGQRQRFDALREGEEDEGAVWKKMTSMRGMISMRACFRFETLIFVPSMMWASTRLYGPGRRKLGDPDQRARVSMNTLRKPALRASSKT